MGSVKVHFAFPGDSLQFERLGNFDFLFHQAFLLRVKWLIGLIVQILNNLFDFVHTLELFKKHEMMYPVRAVACPQKS